MRHALYLTTAALLAACTVGPDYHAPQTSVPAAYTELSKDVATTAKPQFAQWWTTFKDPLLDKLILRAVAANPDLRVAQARVREARALLGRAGADALPTIDAAGGAGRARTSGSIGDLPSVTSNLFRAGFDASWELDVFGGVARSVEAADADVAASVEDRRDVLVSLVAEVARNYMELRAAQRQAAIARETLVAQKETLGLTRSRLDAGVATDLDVARAEVQVEAIASVIPGFESAERIAAHALSALVGEPPAALVRELSPVSAIPASPPEVPVGLPSELLRRRPDVRRAERQLAASTARIGVETAEYFPHFSLTGALGHSSDGLGQILEADSRYASAGGFVRWRLLDFGRVANDVEAATAREEQAAGRYESTVLTSLREVEDALVALSKERTRRASLGGVERSSQRAVDLANQLWTAGRTDFLSVLQAQRDLYQAQDAIVQSDRRAATGLVSLFKALGGGWEIEEKAGPAPNRGEPGQRVIALTPAAAPPAAR